MTIHITKDRLMDCISEIRDAFILEAEYTEEELKRLNAPDAGKVAEITVETPKKEKRRNELFATPADEEEGDIEPQPEAITKYKTSAVVWITMGVALAAAAISLFIFFWTPDRSDVVSTTAETTTEEAMTEAQIDPGLEKLKKAEIGDYITFGSYEQDNNVSNGPEKIEWLVLDREEDSMLVVSRYGLDCQPYNTELEDVTWGTCSLRNWLNGSFYDTAFDTQDKGLIADSVVLDGASYDIYFMDYYKPWYSESATTDRVFIISAAEAHRYLEKSEDRVCQGTAYCRAQGAVMAEDSTCWWWTRGDNSRSYDGMMPIKNAGDTDESVYVDHTQTAVRPAVWINLRTNEGLEETMPAVVTTSETPERTAKKSNATVGDIITFGSYEQDNNPLNGSEDIEWLVLDQVEDRVLVISRYGLDSQPYNTKAKYVTWETCSLRNWLNSSFYDKAFSTEEKGAIISSEITGGDNPKSDAPEGNSTVDNVFLLSIDEATRYFGDDSSRQCLGTDYCFAQGGAYRTGAICWWWLRGPGWDSASGADVLTNGGINTVGAEVNSSSGAVRPAMWIRLEPEDSQVEITSAPNESET